MSYSTTTRRPSEIHVCLAAYETGAYERAMGSRDAEGFCARAYGQDGAAVDACKTAFAERTGAEQHCARLRR